MARNRIRRYGTRAEVMNGTARMTQGRLTKEDFNSVKAMFFADTKAAYKILGLNSNADNSDIKLAYRKMAAKYHPDKVAHLGEEFSKVAEEKFKAINDAYQKIKKERNI